MEEMTLLVELRQQIEVADDIGLRLFGHAMQLRKIQRRRHVRVAVKGLGEKPRRPLRALVDRRQARNGQIMRRTDHIVIRRQFDL